MSEVRGARTRRQWIVLAVGAVLLALVCLLAAKWQWSRYDLHKSQAEQISSAYGADPVPVADLLPAPGEPLPPGDVWRSVTARGHYEADRTVLLRNRPVDGAAVFHVLVPFVVDDPGTPVDGVVLVVDRGTVPLSSSSAERPDAVPAPPSGDVTVVARLRADEPAPTKSAPAGQVQAISTDAVLAAAPGGAAWADGRTTAAYGVMTSEDPAATDAIETLPAPAAPDPDTNLSYTIQWLIFAVGMFAAYAVLWRRERGPRLTAGDLLAGYDDVDTARTARQAARRSGRPTRVSLEDEEDAIVDAQLAADRRSGDAPEPEPQARETSSA
ncbi:SURF1 family protein [Luteimicrobium sp. DT211]|uniref:SURF1 family cytochrome oxidase biogenesis protein n=1 Tax=Luteimicrobium sp. DT211 TaxID=3393412 RepID=UPI003CED2232